MAAASGITPSEQLLHTWSTALTEDSNTRVIKITIDSESLVSSTQLDRKGSYEEDFELLNELIDTASPSYLLYRLEPSTSWLFISYVPDASPVRSKMLYASSRLSLVRALGDSRISTSIFASTKDEITYSAYHSHVTAHQSAAPLTAREQEMAEIRAAEAQERRDGGSESSSQPRSMLDLTGAATGSGEGLAKHGTGFSDDATELVKSFAEGEKEIVQLEIENERIVPSASQPTSLSLLKDSPCFTFYRHQLGTVFIYSCPSSSPIKSRMIYASSFHSVRLMASSLGVDVSKRLETSTPEEITDEFMAAEFGDSVAGDGSGSNTPTTSGAGGGDKPAFARPSRPGRKR